MVLVSNYQARVIAFAVACFAVWRQAYHESRPYENETYRHAQEKLTGLSESIKVVLEQLAIQKSMSSPEVLEVPKKVNLPSIQLLEIENSGFAYRDLTMGRWIIDGRFEKIVARLVKEWRAKP